MRISHYAKYRVIPMMEFPVIAKISSVGGIGSYIISIDYRINARYQCVGAGGGAR